jgi:hypothetical protein
LYGAPRSGSTPAAGVLPGSPIAARLAAAALAVTLVLVLATGASAATRPHYDVPSGYTRCAGAHAWHGFFKWASAKRTSCAYVADFMRAYGGKADSGPMPRSVRGFSCRIHYWRDATGDIYASRHTCTRGAIAIRFYGEV